MVATRVAAKRSTRIFRNDTHMMQDIATAVGQRVGPAVHEGRLGMGERAHMRSWPGPAVAHCS